MAASGRPRAIVADDHPRVRAAATSILAQSCEVVASVADGVSAVDAASRLHPDIVVLDITMPGLDGFQTCTRIRSSGSDARIVFLSNHAGDDFVLEALARGASGFVAKSRMGRDLTDAVGHVHAGRAFVPDAGILPRWCRHEGQRHDLQMHATDAALVDGVVEFFDSALECGDSIVAVATTAHRDAIARHLSARGHDVSDLVATSRYVTMDAELVVETYLQNGRPDPQRFADAFDRLLERALRSAAVSPPRVSLFGGGTGVLHARGLVEAMLHVEQIASDFAASRPIVMLCGCPIDVRGEERSDLAASVCAAHSAIVPTGPVR